MISELLYPGEKRGGGEGGGGGAGAGWFRREGVGEERAERVLLALRQDRESDVFCFKFVRTTEHN